MLNKKIKYYIILIGSIFLLWNIGAKLTSPIFIPDPFTVFYSFIKMALNGQLWIAFIYSFTRITIASIISAVLAIFLGCLIKIYYPINALLSPIVINGNINTASATEFGKNLSVNRAQAVANYLATQGIDTSRMIITGAGNAKYLADQAAGTLNSDASVYQSTDISFLRIEG